MGAQGVVDVSGGIGLGMDDDEHLNQRALGWRTCFILG